MTPEEIVVKLAEELRGDPKFQGTEGMMAFVAEIKRQERDECVKAVEDWWGNHKTREKYPNPANVIRARSK